MVRKSVISLLCLSAAAFGMTALLGAASADTRVADAAMQGDRNAVRALLTAGADVNGPQGDGMTALHWAAMKDDREMAEALLRAGASVQATTRNGAYTPLFLAARNGDRALVEALLAAGADAAVVTTTGATPLMLAAAAGEPDVVSLLLQHGAPINAKDKTLGETALMYAAAYNRSEAIRVLLANGADPRMASTVVNVAAQQAAGRGARGAGGRGAGGRGGAGFRGRAGAPPQAGAQGAVAGGQGANAAAGPPYGAGQGRAGGAAAAQGQGGGGGNGDDSRPAVIDYQGGLTPLLFAARQGNLEAVKVLLDGGSDVNEVSPGDKSSALLIATVNGRFDVAIYLLDRGADPNLASTANATPLYAALNVQYAPHAFYPQPSPAQQKTSHLQLMKALLDHHADPNVKLSKKLWYTGYNFDQSGVDAKGSTPFWRAAQAADVDAMKLLVSYGADPAIASDAAGAGFRQPNGRATSGSDATAAKPPKLAAKVIDGVTPLQMASGAGFDGNFQVIAPGGFLPALKYLVEELHQDVNEADYRGFTPVHNAAFRGDNEMLQYLVSKGADVTVETKGGETAVDMANGPVQRLQPFPETIKLLEGMGVKNNHHCVSCGGNGGD